LVSATQSPTINKLKVGQRAAYSHFLKKGDLGEAKNYRGITLISIAAKVYNSLLRNRIQPEKKYFAKVKMALEKIDQLSAKF